MRKNSKTSTVTALHAAAAVTVFSAGTDHRLRLDHVVASYGPTAPTALATLTLTGVGASPIVLAVPNGLLNVAFADGLQCQPGVDLVATLLDGGAAITGSVLLVTHVE